MLEYTLFEPASSWQRIARTSRRILFVFSIFVTDRAFVEPWHRNGKEICGNVTALPFVITWKMCLLWLLPLVELQIWQNHQLANRESSVSNVNLQIERSP